MHDRVKETLAELCTHFWLAKGRQIVKAVVSSCNTCRRLEGIAYPPPPTAQLPQFRLEDKHPFPSVGVDFLGPLYVKASANSKTMTKVYTALYTCTTTRAVHLELTTAMTTQAVLQSLRRFVGRWGVPSLLVSDNFKSFKAASGKVQALFEAPEVTTFLNEKRIKWRFNLAKVPWKGGFFERMVKST